jgi:cysteine desulfurase family protein (TIGR01976 family)
MNFDTNLIRDQFPGLQRPAIFFDNPGGTQIAKPSLDRMVSYLRNSNANHAGRFVTSRESDAIVDEAHQAAADFLNADRAEEIVFGANMTTLTLHISRTIARTWEPGDTILVTRLDHDANVTPWVMAAEDRGCKVRYVDFNLEDGTLNVQQLNQALESKPRLVAVGYSSNALGTINPLKEIIKDAHAVGALVYVDAVHYAPHGPIDIQDLDCDFLVCSAYKFFGPHVGILYGRYDLLDQLTAYKVRPAPQDPPGKFETGTGNFEGYAGVLGAIEYFEWLGETFGTQGSSKGEFTRQVRLKQAMTAVQKFEMQLTRTTLEVLEETPGVIIYGLRDTKRLDERVPTFAFNIKGLTPGKVAEELGRRDIFVWDGNYYALSITESLGIGWVQCTTTLWRKLSGLGRFWERLRLNNSG